jgi:hypothetical protein
MPHQRNLRGNAKIRAARFRGTSRPRYEGAEKRRIALLEQLSHFDETARAHPSYKHALTLLNQRFRRARIAQRIAILKAAQWLIALIEMSSGIV